MERKFNRILKADENLQEKINYLKKSTKWMDKCTMLMIDDTVIHGLTETSCNYDFTKKNFKTKHLAFDFLDMNWGMFVHTDCWKYIKNTYNVPLKFSNLLPFGTSYNNYKSFDIDYGEIESYWRQSFRFGHIMVENKMYLCSSPLKKDKNITQIKRNINNLGVRHMVGRKSPTISATYFSDNNIKLGNNGKLWYVKNGKWNELKENVEEIKLTIDISKLTKRQHKWLRLMSYITQYNDEAIFILDAKLKKRNTYDVVFLCADSCSDKLHKLI